MNVALQNVQTQIADMERELLALSSNQMLAPKQISTYAHSVVVDPYDLDNPENNHYTAVFPNGVKLFQAYGSNATIYSVGVDGNNVDIHAASSTSVAGTVTIVSLGEFNFV